MKFKHLLAIISMLLTSGVTLSSTDIEARVIGGQTTSDNWPFIVSLYLDNSFFCGGTLISSEHILTAAHCVDGVNACQLLARVGSNQLANYISETVSIKAVNVHPGYSTATVDNDLAILTLTTPLSNVPIPVTTQEATTQATPAPFSVLGWGDTDPNDSIENYPKDLQQANLNIVDYSDCKTTYETLLTDNMICATEYHTDSVYKDACQGDSGGPLIEDLGGGNFQQVGIVSWGIGCGSTTQPGVYTDVSNYSAWIDNVISGATPASFGVIQPDSRATSLAEACRTAAPKKSGGSFDFLLLLLLLPLGLKRLRS